MEKPRVAISTSAPSPMPIHSRTLPMKAVPAKVAAAASTKPPPIATARARFRRITQMKSVSSGTRSASARSAERSDPMAPIAAPRRPTSDRMPATVSPAGAAMSSTSISPPSPSRPGMAESTALMSDCQATGLSLNHSAANENPNNTPAKTENSARYVIASASIAPRRSE
ncbi:hypothetical protein GCM10009643_21530 [Microbacterium aurantiacum]